MLRSLLVLVLNVLVLSSVCHACQCLGAQRPCQRASRPGAVIFVGRVLETTPPYRAPGPEDPLWVPPRDVTYSMRFAVEESLSGDLGAEVRVLTDSGLADCGMPLSPGKRFLINTYKESGELWTSACMGNVDLNRDVDPENVVEEYRTALRGESQTIFGTVMLYNTHGARYEPVKGLVVRAYSGEFAAVAITGEDGKYELGGMPIGKYTVVPEVGSNLEYDRKPASQYQADLGKGECKEIYFRLRPK